MQFIKQVFSEFSENNCSTLAAGLAFYTAFALPPLLYLLLSILTLGLSVFLDADKASENAKTILVSQTSQLIGNSTASDQISTILKNHQEDTGKWWKAALGFVGILLGATGIVGALQTALNRVWEVKPDPNISGVASILVKRAISLGMILGLGFLLLVSLVVSSIVAAFGDRLGSYFGFNDKLAEVLNYSVQAVVVLVIFASIFKFMPDAKIQWRDVFVGSLVTTALFLIGRFAMQIYFTYDEPGAQLGEAAASLAVLLMWVYYTAMIVLFGAEITQVYAVRYGKGIQPESHAVQVVEQSKRIESSVERE